MKGVKKSRIKLLEKELEPYRDVFNQAVETILNQEISEYPIMVVHQEVLEVGVPIVDRTKVAGNWSVNISTLEEFRMKNLISSEKIESFTSLFESHTEHICLFLLSEFGANFVFLKNEKSK